MRKLNIKKIKQLSVIPLIFILVTGVTPAFAGPVIVDGTDSPDHGQNWAYIQNAAKSLLAQETRAGEHTTDILSFGTVDNNSGGGGAINRAASNEGFTVQHCPGAESMQACFDGIQNGSINPGMLYFPGTGSPNVLSGSEGAVLTANAALISSFVASGGGVLSHGSGTTSLGWLSVILPGLNFPGGCRASGAERTAEGIEAFPDISDANIRGICHNTFTGNFGGLIVLALDGNGAPFIIGLGGGTGGSIETGTGGGSNGGDNQWDKRPTFGVNHENREDVIVDSGYVWNDLTTTITDNHHTEFTKKSIEIGIENTFSQTVYADKGLKIAEFAWGIPVVGESQNAQTRVEVYYDGNMEIDEVKVVQSSNVIDTDTLSVSHQWVKCLPSDLALLCNQTTIGVTFLEPLNHDVAAIHAIDTKNRDQWTYINDGFDISGDSLNPMLTKEIPSAVKYEGLLKVTQVAKYSPYWTTEDDRMFEMNSAGSFKQINQSFERFQDTGNAFTRVHSGFGGIIAYEENRALNVFDASKLVSELPESFTHIYPETGQRITEEMRETMLLQEQIANQVLDEMDKQDRNY